MKPEELEARIDLAAALRWANRLGYGEGICNHFSLEVPGRPGHFLINPQGLHWSEVTPGDLVVVDAAGRKVEGRYGVEPTAFFIHGAMHRSKPSAKCVLHTHMPYATALTIVHGGASSGEPEPLKFHGRVAYDDNYSGFRWMTRKAAMCAPGKEADVLFPHPRDIVCGRRALAFDDLYYLERACCYSAAMGTGSRCA